MVELEIVHKANRDLRELRDDLKANGGDPRFARLLEILIPLTQDDNLEAEPAPAPEDEAGDQEEHPQGPCEHPHLDVFGRCADCGECQHTNARDGVCITCDAEVPAEVPAQGN